MAELWRNCKGFIGWQVSNLGHLRSRVDDYNRLSEGDYYNEPTFEWDGELRFEMRRGDITAIFRAPVDWFVAMAFCEKGDHWCIRHIDGDLLNCKATNLEWYTPEYDPRGEPVLATSLLRGIPVWYPSAGAAAEALGLHRSNIVNVLNGKNYSSGGFMFRYANEEAHQTRDTRFDVARGYIKAVNLKDGRIFIFETICDAAKMLGVPRSNITAVVMGHRKSAGGWRFVRQD